MPSLKDKVAIITGASSGIGAAIGEAFAAEGAHVVLAARSVDKLQTLASQIQAAGGSAMAVETDVTDEASVQALFERVAREFSRLDLLVNNAGLSRGGPIEAMDFATWRKVLSVNLDGAFLCSREAFKLMVPRKCGRIINIGSVSAKVPRVNSAPYTSSKFGLDGLTRCLALDGRPHGISAGILNPGNTLTPIWDNRKEVAESEGTMTVEDLAMIAVSMAVLPNNVCILESTVLPISMPFVGRG